jgi:hypothetical protein
MGNTSKKSKAKKASDAPDAPKKKTVFDTINALSSVRPLTYQQLQDDGFPYEPFLINRAFSLSEETIGLANLMNKNSGLDKEMHATFYIHALRPRRRFEQWPKALVDEEAKTIAQYYGMSLREAKLHRNLHTKDELDTMRTIVAEGIRLSRSR